MNKSLLLLISTLIALASCSTELIVDIPEQDQALTVYGFINPEDTISTVYVNRTAAFGETFDLDQTLLQIPATVELLDGSEVLSHFMADGQSPIYSGSHHNFGVSGQTYRLRAEHPEFGSIEATSTLPAKVPMQEVKAIHNFTARNGELIEQGIEVTFDDPANQANFYHFASFDTIYNNSFYPIKLVLADILSVNAPELIGIEYIRDYVLSDNGFNGERISLRFAFIEGTGVAPTDKARLEIRFLDEPEYRYLEAQFNTTDLELDPVIEPSPIYTNFNYGFGVFSLSLTEVYEVQ